MKQLFNFALIGAIALTSATMFVGCNSSEDSVAENNNPNFNEKTNEITTQFVLNVATNAKSNEATRSSATTVQEGGLNFRGIDNTVLFAYQTSGQKFVGATQIAADAAKRYDLGTVLAAGAITETNSNRVLELAIPTETDAMMFYGKAIKGSMSDAEAGKITYNVTGSTANTFSFSLNDRIGDNKTKYDQTADLLAFILTRVINVSAEYTVNTTQYPTWTGDATISTTLQELGDLYIKNNDSDPSNNGRALSPLEEILGSAFAALTTIKDGEYRAGSSEAILAIIDDLHAIAESVGGADPTSPYEELAKSLGLALSSRIGMYFIINSDEVTGFNTLSNIKTHVINASTATGIADEAAWNARFGKVEDGDLANFPVTTFNLPKGAALLTYDGTNNTFGYLKRKPIIGGAALDEDESTRYQYPAELMYFANSSIRTSNTEKKKANYPNGVSNWDTVDWKTLSLGTNNDWSAAGSKVTSDTRATAMTQNVNYGVALLETKVGIKTGITHLDDNNQQFHPSEAVGGFAPADLDLTLTGVLIGGQAKSVDWEYLPVSGTAYDRVIYDNSIGSTGTGIAVPKEAGGTSAPNYTLVFDNWTTGTTQNSTVRVALEFVNNSDNFWGEANEVKKGTTFYLVGQLNLGTKTITDWDTYYQVPPLDGTGKSTKTTRIFTQDYKTIATFILDENSLKHAYNTVPDLRSSQLSFGLSVDIKWKPGLQFDDVVLGGN